MNSNSTQSETQATNSGWREVFAMDYRSLALYRILLGLILIADLLFRLPTLVAMYTDQGVITRQVLSAYYDKWIGLNWEYGVWSLHWLSGESWFQYVLFGLAALAAVSLTLGWKTRTATIVSWILLASLHVRNPLVLTSGDTILKLVLFWSIFLPLGKFWSLDSRQNNFDSSQLSGKRFYSLATVGFIVQIILMYFFTGVAKCNPDWFSGDAMEYVMRLNIYILPMGSWLLEHPLLMTVATYATLFIEVIGIWFLLLPKNNGMWRLIVMLTYWAFHVGIGLSMAIGLFPIICLIIWIPLIPTMCWNWLAKSDKVESGKIDVNPFGPFQLVSNSVLVVALVFVVLINISNVDHPVCQKFMPRAIAPIGFWLNLDQRFQMFGQPPKSNPWFVYEATLRDKTQIDLMRDSEVDHNRPEIVRLSLPSHHWRKLHRNLVNPVRKEVRQSLADYAVQHWNATHSEEKQVVRMRLLCYSETIGPDYDGTSRQQVVWGSYKDPKHAAGSKFDDAVESMLDGLPF